VPRPIYIKHKVPELEKIPKAAPQQNQQQQQHQKIDLMFFVFQKIVLNIHHKSISPKDSLLDLISTLSNQTFLTAVEDCGYTLNRFLTPELKACEYDAAQAVNNLGEFVTEAIWDTILTAA
jgi:hypothetical protein